MKTFLKFSVFALFGLMTFACKQKDKVETQDPGLPEASGWEVSTEVQEENILKAKEKTEQMFKAAREALNVEERILEPENEGGEPVKLVLRYDTPGVPVVLEVSEPTATAKMQGLSVFYFHDKQLYAVDQPLAHYLFQEDKLKIWTNENWLALKDISSEDWLDRENDLLHQAKMYLEEFGIEY